MRDDENCRRNPEDKVPGGGGGGGGRGVVENNVSLTHRSNQTAKYGMVILFQVLGV